MHRSKSKKYKHGDKFDTITVIVHDRAVGDAVTASSLAVAKAFASESALKQLRNVASADCLDKICDCATALSSGSRPSHALGAVQVEGYLPCINTESVEADCTEASETLDKLGEEQAPDDCTEAGFAAIARQKAEGFMDASTHCEHGPDERDEEACTDED